MREGRDDRRDLEGSLDAFLRLLREAGPRAAQPRPEVSGWSALHHGQHVARALAVTVPALQALAAGASDRILRDAAPGAEVRALLDAGRIPAGRAEAPAPTRPEEEPAAEAVLAALEEQRALWSDPESTPAEATPGDRCWTHPALGPLDARAWLRFSAVHVAHHLDIARRTLDDRG